MILAAQPVNQILTEKMIGYGIEDFNTIMVSASVTCDMEIITQMLSLGANDYNSTMNTAAKYGHIELVDKMLYLGANNYNATMASAAHYGYVEIVNKMLHLGATSYDGTIESAKIGYLKLGNSGLVLDIFLNAPNILGDFFYDSDEYSSHLQIIRMISAAKHRHSHHSFCNKTIDYICSLITVRLPEV